MNAEPIDAKKPLQAAIEEELRQRMAAEKDGASPVGAVSLVCLQCRGLSSGDAQFCTRCGTRFNALVVGAERHATPTRGGPA